MRTTLILEKDVAAMVERLRRARGQTLEALVNDALREGLKRLAMRSPAGGQFDTRSVDLGQCPSTTSTTRPEPSLVPRMNRPMIVIDANLLIDAHLM